MRILLLSFLIVAACTRFPELEGTISDAAREAPYPTLTEIPVAPPVTGFEEESLQQRIAALQTRAAQIRRIDISALQ